MLELLRMLKNKQNKPKTPFLKVTQLKPMNISKISFQLQIKLLTKKQDLKKEKKIKYSMENLTPLLMLLKPWLMLYNLKIPLKLSKKNSILYSMMLKIFLKLNNLFTNQNKLVFQLMLVILNLLLLLLRNLSNKFQENLLLKRHLKKKKMPKNQPKNKINPKRMLKQLEPPKPLKNLKNMLNNTMKRNTKKLKKMILKTKRKDQLKNLI